MGGAGDRSAHLDRPPPPVAITSRPPRGNWRDERPARASAASPIRPRTRRLLRATWHQRCQSPSGGAAVTLTMMRARDVLDWTTPAKCERRVWGRLRSPCGGHWHRTEGPVPHSAGQLAGALMRRSFLAGRAVCVLTRTHGQGNDLLPSRCGCFAPDRSMAMGKTAPSPRNGCQVCRRRAVLTRAGRGRSARQPANRKTGWRRASAGPGSPWSGVDAGQPGWRNSGVTTPR